LKRQSHKLFEKLSSGHKIVLMTITRLVETVEEKTLVLLDEPEAHLHPPLLAALIRALSDLLTNRNGVAVIATHSPVVLQEVPRSCVWKIRRSGTKMVAERPDVETFGENVGILTREVFGLEVTASGFHKMLREAVDESPDFDQILQRFGGELGGEARAIVRALLGARRRG
jgi:predicted ATP-dependent endonuclease of OLD family